MASWRKLAVRSAAFGAGFALAACFVAGIWFCHGRKPRPPKPWNTSAIRAEYHYVAPSGEKSYLTFYYVLENSTDFDYRIASGTGIETAARLKATKSLGSFTDSGITIESPIFIPARSRTLFSLTIPYPCPLKEDIHATLDERKQYRAAVAKFAASELSNIDGFVLFDTSNRYEIDFPNGWAPSEREAPTRSE